MDPVTIITTAVALIGGTSKLIDHIGSLREKLRKRQLDNRAIDTLWIEITGLNKDLAQLHRMCTDFGVGLTEAASNVRKSEDKYWSNIKDTMKDCEAALQSLEGIVQGLKQKDSVLKRMGRAATLQSRLDDQKDSIELHKQQITAYRRTISMSLQLIAVSAQLRSENKTKHFETQLSAARDEINVLRLQLRGRGRSQNRFHRDRMRHLERTINSAEEFVSTAASIALESLGSEEPRNTPPPGPTEEGQPRSPMRGGNGGNRGGTPRNSDDAPPRLPPITLSDSKSIDLQPHTIAQCKPTFEEAYISGDYKMAKRFLERYRVGREHWDGVTFEGRDTVLEMLVLCYCRLEQWERAEQLLDSTEFVGREAVTKRLVLCYMQRRDWDAAERILTQKDSKYDNTIWKRHTLSEVYFAKDNYDLAIEYCQKTRVEIAGKYRDSHREHMPYFMSIALLADIYERRGSEEDKDEAQLLKRLLPPNFNGEVSKSSNKLMQDCRKLDTLSRLWPEVAAEKMEVYWSASFLHLSTERPDLWSEIKENVRHGNITGSGGGYTLLHAFIREGNAVATKYLLDNGMDVNAKTNITRETPLHLAITHQKLEICQLLLNNGSDAFSEDNAGINPWELAISSKKTAMMEILAEHATNPSMLFSTKSSHKSPLGIAIANEKNAAALKLIERGGKIGASKVFWNEVLLFATGRGDAITETVEKLLELGASVDYKNGEGHTPLMIASEKGWEKIVRLLLKTNPDLETADATGHRALSLAAEKGFEGIVKCLLDAGAKVDGYPRDRTPHLITHSPAVLELLRKKQAFKKRWFHRPIESVSYADMTG